MSDPDVDYDRINYVIILLFSFIFLIIFILYFFLIIQYVFLLTNEKKIINYWKGYLITIFAVLSLLLIYLISLFNTKQKRLNSINDITSNSFSILINTFLVLIFYILLDNLIFDLIKTLNIILKIKKVLKIEKTQIEELSRQLENMNIQELKSKDNYIYHIVFGIINCVLIVIFILTFINYNKDIDILIRDKLYIFTLKNFTKFLMQNIFFIILVILITSIFSLNYFKKQLLNKNYYNPNYFAMKLYNINYFQIIYFADISFFRLIIDFLLNLPIIFFISLHKFNGYILIILQVCFFLYILIGGALYLIIDKNVNEFKIPKNLKFWFCFKKFYFNFGENIFNYSFDEINYQYTKEEKEILKNLNINARQNIESNLIKDNKEQKTSLHLEVQSINEENKLSSSFKNPKKNNFTNILDFSTSSELYILYKLLDLYFIKNKNLYETLLKKINEDGTPFKRFFIEKNSRKSRVRVSTVASRRKQDFLLNIDRVSRMSKLDSKNVIHSLTLKQDKIFVSLEEKELREEFKMKFKLADSHISFKIESLLSSSFFELFPFYQMNIKDIIRSLNPSDNKKMYDVFIKNLFNQSEPENKILFTYDSFLMVEIYEVSEFISFENLTKFTSVYKEYILNTVKNINFTFLPLILAVFNLEFCGENKIVVLYRNPLFFTNCNHFNHWINFYLTEGPEKLKVSLMLKDIIDLNEIEIKNSLRLNGTDYNEVKNILKNDLEFLSELNLQIFPIIHLFIGDEKEEVNAGATGQIVNNNEFIETSYLGDSTVNQENFSELLNVSGDFSFNIINKKQDSKFSSEFTSLLDKEYYSMTLNDIHTIKIYFANFFRTTCDLNKKVKKDNNAINSSYYCQFLESQLLTYLNEPNLLESEDNENN